MKKKFKKQYYVRGERRMSQNNVILHVTFQQIPTHSNRFGASNNSSCKFNWNSTVQISEQKKVTEVRNNL
jgi:hypothetical protein